MTIFAFKIMDRKDRRTFGLAGNELSTQYYQHGISRITSLVHRKGNFICM